MSASLSPVVGTNQGPFLTNQQKVLAAVVLTMATSGAAALTAYVGPDGSLLGKFVAVTATCATADVLATGLRHPQGVPNLAWHEFFGRGGHVGAVGVGLGATFGLLSGAFDVFPLPPSLEPHRANIKNLILLVAGILPWVLYDAAKNPAHEGHRGETAVRESIKTVAGSALATALEPLVGQILANVSDSAAWYGISTLLTTVAGYWLVLVAGWQDIGRLGLSEAEVAQITKKT